MSNQAATLAQPHLTPPPAVELAAAHRQTLRLTPAAADKRPRWIWRVVDWKYNVDQSSKRLKKLYFQYAFLPFNRLSYWLFDLLPPNGRDQTGRLCWTEDQGCQETEWEAEQEAMRYPFGHCIRVPLSASLPAATVNTEQIHPNSPREVQRMYEKKTTPATIEVPRIDMVRLASKIAASDSLVEHLKAT